PCPSGVHYMPLVDHARAHIEQTYRRPLGERLLRALLAKLMPYPGRFRLALYAAMLGEPPAPLPLRPRPPAASTAAPAADRRRGRAQGARRLAQRLCQRRAGARDQRR